MADETVSATVSLSQDSVPYFCCANSRRAPQNFFIDLELTAIGRQSLRKFLGEVSLHNEALNAALLQQTAASAALRRSSDLSAIHHHVGANRIREAVASAGDDRAAATNPVGVNAPTVPHTARSPTPFKASAKAR